MGRVTTLNVDGQFRTPDNEYDIAGHELLRESLSQTMLSNLWLLRFNVRTRGLVIFWSAPTCGPIGQPRSTNLAGPHAIPEYGVLFATVYRQ